MADVVAGHGNGSATRRFEEKFADYNGAAGAVFAASGRMSLRLILKALDYPPGSGIVLPAFTHFSIPAVIQAMGLKPIFADVDPATSEITPQTVQAALAPEARALIPTHLFGRTCAMPELLELARAKGLDVIEDCAQALGARIAGAPAGSFGRAAYCTFGITKNFTTFSGGMALTRDAELLKRMRDATAGFRRPAAGRLLKEGLVAAAMNFAACPPLFSLGLAPLLRLGRQDRPDIIHNLFEEPVRVTPESAMTAWQWLPGAPQARAGLRQMLRLDAANNARREAGTALRNELERLGCSGLPALPEPEGDHIFMSFALRRPERFRFIAALRRLGVDSSPGYMSNCCRLPELGGQGPEHCPAAELLANEIVHIPLYPGLGARSIKKIARAVAQADAT